VTEDRYASQIKASLSRDAQRQVSIEIDRDNESHPLQLVEKAVKKVKNAKKAGNPYSDVWIFFDNDNCNKIKDVFKIIKRDNFKFAYSSICIEHWFLLHFEDCGRAFLSAAEAKTYLVNRHWPQYHKTQINHYKHLEGNLQVAIQRARNIRKRADDEEDNYEVANPYFTVDKLIEMLINL
jgi:hypothetical protein